LIVAVFRFETAMFKRPADGVKQLLALERHKEIVMSAVANGG